MCRRGPERVVLVALWSAVLRIKALRALLEFERPAELLFML